VTRPCAAKPIAHPTKPGTRTAKLAKTNTNLDVTPLNTKDHNPPFISPVSSSHLRPGWCHELHGHYNCRGLHQDFRTGADKARQIALARPARRTHGFCCEIPTAALGAGAVYLLRNAHQRAGGESVSGSAAASICETIPDDR